MAKKIPVIIDVDTGFDDALALLLALRSPQLDVRGITCVAGNQRLPQVVVNTLKIVEVAGASTPVAAGMDRPLLESMRTPLALHGADGMADLDLPAPRRTVEAEHAVEFMRRLLIQANEPLTLICLAPLTNIAVLLRMYPDLRSRIDRIFVMGGALAASGNTSALAEFNVRHDPEAAAMVLESGLAICLYPLDVFRAIRFTRTEAAAFVASDLPVARVAGRILDFSCNYFERDDALVGDAGTVATVIEPAACHIEAFPVTVELGHGAARGMTVLDRRPTAQRQRLSDWWTTSPAEIEVITDVDTERYRTLIRDRWLSPIDSAVT